MAEASERGWLPEEEIRSHLLLLGLMVHLGVPQIKPPREGRVCAEGQSAGTLASRAEWQTAPWSSRSGSSAEGAVRPL